VVVAGRADETRVAERLAERRDDLAVERETSASGVLDAVDGGAECVVVADGVGEGDAVDLLRTVREAAPDVPVVLVPSEGDESLAAAALEAGATAYVPREDGVVPVTRLADRVASAVAVHRETDQHRLERSYGELVSELTEVFERVSDAFFALDEDWRFTYVNETAATLLEVDGSAVVGERIWEEFEEAVGTTFHEKFQEAMASQEPVSFAEYYEPLRAWFEVNAYPSESGLSVYFRDVTERKEREQELEASRRRLRTLLDRMPNGAVALFDGDFRHQVVGGETFGEMDVDTADLEGERVDEVLPADVAEVLLPHYEAALQGEGSSFTVEYGGEVREFQTAPVPGDDGEVSAGMTISRDVTERRTHQRRLRALHDASQDLFRAETAAGVSRATVWAARQALDLAGVAIYEYDAHADELVPTPGSSAGLLEGQLPRLSVAEDSLVGHAFVEGETKLYDDVREEADLYADPAETPIRSALLVPYGDDHVFVAGSEEVGAFDERTRQLVEIVAATAVAAYERVEREQELETRVGQQDAVARLGRRALEDLPLDVLFEEAAALVTERLGTDFSKVLDYRPAAGELALRAGEGWDPGVVGEATVPDERDSQAGYVLESEEPVVVEDMTSEERFEPEALLTDHGVRSGVSVVVGSTEDPWGVMGTHHTDRRTFSEEDVNFVQSVANVLASSIENRRRQRELRETAEVFREMYRLAADEQLTFEDRLDRLLDLGRDYLGLDAGVLTRFDDGRGTFTAVRGAVAGVEEGETWPLAETRCGEVLADEQLVGARDLAATDLLAESVSRRWAARAFVAAPITVEDERYGALSFAGEQPRTTDFDEAEETFVELASQWVGFELERRRRKRDLERTERQFQAVFDNPSSFMAILDPDGTVRTVNEMALEFVGVDHEAVVGEPFWETPWWDHTPALQERLRAWIEQVRDGEYVRFEEAYHAPDGETVTVDGVLQPVTDDDGEVVAIFESGRDISDRKERERQLERQRKRLAALNDINSLVHRVGEAVVQQSDREEIERLVCQALAESASYDFAWVGELEPDGDRVRDRVQAGDPGYVDGLDIRTDGAPERDGPTVSAIRTGEMQVVEDVAEDEDYEPWRERALDHGYRSSAAVPITYEDARYGVLNVYSERSDAFGEEERAAFERLGTIIAHAVRSVEREHRLRESERRYRTLAENIPNGAVALVDEELRYQLVAGETFEHVDVDPVDLEGERVQDVDVLGGGLQDQLVDVMRAALDGEEVSTELETADRTYVVHVIPVEQDGEVHGAMSLSQDVTERVRREEELEHERERLELLNRLIRHNLLNSLNVVEARLGLLEGHVDDAADEHLATALDRTGEMIDLIETIRALMRAVDEEDEQDLESVSLDAMLREEVRTMAAAYPEAEFALDGLPSVDVRADELLAEVFENLLVNAVQHNDAETPRVWIDVAVGDDAAVVEVADNGPGVPDELREIIFDKGTKGFESPGTGFGLHLVREIVDAYGGDVGVDDDESGGARFRVRLPRA
jgi:PAS domain S-box-containing protein